MATYMVMAAPAPAMLSPQGVQAELGAACFGQLMVGPALQYLQPSQFVPPSEVPQPQQPQQQGVMPQQLDAGWALPPMAAMYVPVPVLLPMAAAPNLGQALLSQLSQSLQDVAQGSALASGQFARTPPECVGNQAQVISRSTSDGVSCSSSSYVSEHQDLQLLEREPLPKFAQHTAEELCEVISSKDPVAIAAHQDCRGDPNIEVHLVDVGISYKGRDGVLAMKHRLIRAIPDLAMSYLNSAECGPQRMAISAIWSGTQVEPFFPLFPCGRSARWRVHLEVSLNDFLKAKSVAFHFNLEPIRPLELSNLYGLAQSALLLASTSSGSRMLQEGIQSASGESKEILLDQLRGHVWDTAASPHGNHVLQKYIVEVPPPLVGFIIDEFRGRAVAAAQHNTRSRVLERLLEHCPSEQTAPLADELLCNVLSLARSPFGNFVLQRLLEHGTPDQRHRVVNAMMSQVGQLARHRQANNVVRYAIMHCCMEDKLMLAHKLAAEPKGFAGLARHSTGSFVMRELKLAGLADGARAREADTAADAAAERAA